MARNLDSTLLTALSADVIEPIVLATLTFRNSVEYLCSAGYDVSFAGNLFKGIGTLCGLSAVTEGTDLRADGLQVTLSGIDPANMADCLAEIQPLAPASFWLGLMQQGQFIGTPYRFFNGVVDAPTISIGPTSASITLKLETRIALLNRPSQRRYTSADQHANGYSDDTSFAWVEKLNDTNLRWGQSS